MYIFFENGTSGGVSNISNRYSKAKNRLFKDYLTCISTKLYIAQLFDKNLVAIRKSKLALMLNKPAHIEMCT